MTYSKKTVRFVNKCSKLLFKYLETWNFLMFEYFFFIYLIFF